MISKAENKDYLIEKLSYMFSPLLLNQILEVGSIEELKANSYVIDIGDPIDFLPIVLDGSLKILTEDWAGFNVAGPKARELLSELTDADLANDTFKFMRSRQIRIAGIDAIALRVSFTGDLGWEIHCPVENQSTLFEALMEKGEAYDARLVGSRALLSLRVEKGYGSWSREYSPEYWPQEVGLDRLIKLDKPEFLGREAYLEIKDLAPREKLVILQIETEDADANGGEPIFLEDGTPVGRVSSGAYSHTTSASLALCFVRPKHATAGTKLNVAVLGTPHRAVILENPPFDAYGNRLRS